MRRRCPRSGWEDLFDTVQCRHAAHTVDVLLGPPARARTELDAPSPQRRRRQCVSDDSDVRPPVSVPLRASVMPSGSRVGVVVLRSPVAVVVELLAEELVDVERDPTSRLLSHLARARTW